MLRVDSIERVGNQVALKISAQAGHDFILWRSPTLVPGSWQAVTNAIRSEAAGQLILTDPTPGPGRAFYRVQRDTNP